MGEAVVGRPDGPSRPRPLRLFVAVDPSEGARDAVASAISPWRSAIPQARWIDRAAWHVTLKFLGATPPDLVGRVGDMVAGAAAEVEPFEARLAGLGVFPARGRSRILWVGIEDGRLEELALAVDRALTPLAEPEGRPLHPHLTVARLRPALPIPEAFTSTEVARVSFSVDRICLYRSHLGGGPARYERLAAIPLGTG